MKEIAGMHWYEGVTPVARTDFRNQSFNLWWNSDPLTKFGISGSFAGGTSLIIPPGNFAIYESPYFGGYKGNSLGQSSLLIRFSVPYSAVGSVNHWICQYDNPQSGSAIQVHYSQTLSQFYMQFTGEQWFIPGTMTDADLAKSIQLIITWDLRVGSMFSFYKDGILKGTHTPITNLGTGFGELYCCCSIGGNETSYFYLETLAIFDQLLNPTQVQVMDAVAKNLY
jgi:hypothetical protein